MKAQAVIRNLAGQSSIVAILLLVLVIAIAGVPQLRQKQAAARLIGSDLAIGKAEAIAEALLATASKGRPLDVRNELYVAHHLRDALVANATRNDPLANSAVVKALRADPSRPAIRFERINGKPLLYYAVPDLQGGILVLELSPQRELVAVGRYLGQSHLADTALSYVLIGLLVLGIFGLRIFLRTLAELPLEQRRAVIAGGLEDGDGSSRRNLLPWLLALCGIVFAIDLHNSMDSAVGIGYILAVIISLSSNRYWHGTAIAATGTVLLFIAPLMAPTDIQWWQYLESHAVIVFAIIVTGLFGSTHLRKTHAEALALAEATRSRHETDEIRAALARAEAAEAQRRTISDQLQMANQAAGISMWEWDISTDLVVTNEGSEFSERVGGIQPYHGERYAAQIVYPDDVQQYRLAFTKALCATTGDGRFAHRYRVCRAGGGIQHIQFHAQTVRDAHGVIVRVLGVDWDVTKEVEAAHELEQQATQLREAELRLERASLSSLEAHWEVDFGTEDGWFSSSFATLTGHDPQYLRTLKTAARHELVHPDDISLLTAVQLHQQDHYPTDVPIRLRRADGEYRWFQLRGSVQRDAGGQPIRAAGSIRDIHRQKLSEDLLRETQLRFERAVSGTQDALFDTDLRTGDIWRSPRYYEMLGYESGEFGTAPQMRVSLVHPDDRAMLEQAVNAHLEHNVPYDTEFRMRHKQGHWIWMRTRAKAEHDKNGKAIRLAGSIHDITEQREARDALRKAGEQATAASHAKSTFLATMSHEIRTPMNGVIGMTGLLLDTGLDRVQREYAETIRASADSLLTILNDILDFSKIEAGKLDIEAIELDLTASVDGVGSILAFQAAAKGLELVIDVRPEVPERVCGDPQRIRQCLLNLVGNAIKFTQSGEVVLEVCSLGQQDGRSLLHFEVRDTGIGIPPATLQNLFQPFTQVDSSTTRQFGGTGLGLSIVRKLVELMGGQTGAQSEPGKGSTFWFTLPLEAVMTSTEKTPLAPVSTGKRVLLVDDNETNRRVLSNQMVHAGYEVETAASADAALTLLRAQLLPFDVVMLDYHMPEMDGAMLGERIMHASDIAPTRLLLLTSLDRSGDMQRFADIGFSAYLTKPVRTRELLDCLDKTLSHTAQDWHLRSQPIITRGSLIAGETPRQYSGKIMIVEDNVINQRVARRFLERLGCEVHVVDDGAQAVAAYQQQSFSFILMDMQMPVMDGVEAARRIREIENGGRRTPIVALTANAMVGTLERCLEAGMDDYLTKPLDIARLQTVLDRLIHGDTANAAQCAALPESAAHQPASSAADSHYIASPEVMSLPLDSAIRARLADIAGDDREFVLELVDAFVAGSEDNIREMHAAVASGNCATLGRAAHKLKGASSNLHIDVLAALAQDVETNAKAGTAEGVPQTMVKIAAEFLRVAQALRAEMNGGPSPRAAVG